MTTTVRAIKEAEAKPWLDQLGRTFFTPSREGQAEHFLTHVELDRTRAAFDGEAIVGTLRSFPTELTVPGPGPLAASALTMVSVAPTHRRRGLLTEMIGDDLRDSADRGEAVSILLAAEYPIYGRFGYGVASEAATYAVTTTELRFFSEPEGSVELVDLATFRTLAQPIYERFRPAQTGSIGRTDHWWDRTTRQIEVPGDEPRKGFQAVYRSTAGELEGYVMYEGSVDWSQLPLAGTTTIQELIATTPAAYLALWQFCAGLDLQTAMRAEGRAVDELLPLLVDDGRKVKCSARYDYLWVRILDAPSALAARTYTASGRLVLEVRDPRGFASDTYALEGGPDGATCKPTTESPDLTVSVAALGAAYLGGESWIRLHDAGRLDEHRDGAVALADLMFRTARAPWCTTHF